METSLSKPYYNTSKPLTKVEKLRLKRKTRRLRRKQKLKSGDLPTFKQWTEVPCVICSDPMRELCQESPIELNEHINLNIFALSCGHQYHAACFLEWYKKQRECPYCRTKIHLRLEDLTPVTVPRLSCRATIQHSRDKSKIGKQCECLESPNNMGFCRKHLPPLLELTKSEVMVDLYNRKVLTLLKYEHLREFPKDIQKDLLTRAHALLKQDSTKPNKSISKYNSPQSLLKAIEENSHQSYSKPTSQAKSWANTNETDSSDDESSEPSLDDSLDDSLDSDTSFSTTDS